MAEGVPWVLGVELLWLVHLDPPVHFHVQPQGKHNWWDNIGCSVYNYNVYVCTYVCENQPIGFDWCIYI